MKFRFACAAASSALSLAAGLVHAQTPTPAVQDPPPAATQWPPTDAPSKGKVVFSRSINENGEVITQSAPAAAAQPEIATVSAPTAEDSDRQAVKFTDIDLDVHLRPAEQQIAVRAQLNIRNDGKAPLARVPLQISSTLNWERVRVNDRDAAFTVATLNSDTDHTGQLHEAAVALDTPLAPGASAHLDVTYSGVIAVDAKRLLAIGTPDDAAIHSDWDEVSTSFTGLRGFGNVAWYPVSSLPSILGDGARVFDEIGRHKLRLSSTRFHLHLAIEFPPGQPPTVALVNGHPMTLAVTPSPGEEAPGVAIADSGPMTLGFEAPSLFVAVRTPHTGASANVFALPEDANFADGFLAAATTVTPFLKEWLGSHPRSQLTLLDLPDPHDAPFETGSMLALPIRTGPGADLEGVMVHALAHARLRSSTPPPAWLDEGLATFLGTMWIEDHQGRERALGTLEAARSALALAEPSSPGESPGQPLAESISPVYYRTKATYVFWMLRDLVGEADLVAALHAYDPVKGTEKDSAHGLLEKLLEQSPSHRDLAWFFADWVDADHGLPDLSIESVFPSATTADFWLVTVNIANGGYAAAEVPLTVRSGETSITQRVMIPAHGKVSPRIQIEGKPVEVRLNDGVVPETQASIHVFSLERAASPAAAPDAPSQQDPPQP